MTITNKTNKLKVPQINFYGTGKRKSSIAKVWIFEGSGKFEINKINPDTYFGSKLDIVDIMKPFKLLNIENTFDIKISVLGGGKSAQVDACILGISRALLLVNPSYREKLKEQGLLTRDARVKERKKYGLRKARKAPQYRKR